MNLSGLEPDATVLIKLDPRFPAGDVQEIGHRLMASGAIVPGYIPALVGVFDIRAVYSSEMEGYSTTVLPDRNIASRMARVAREGTPSGDPVTQVAIELMAYAQAMNIDIDPGLAFHELAHRKGNEVAWDELRWFRAADEGNALAWIDLALGRRNNLSLVQPEDRERPDLAAPIERWRRNYVVTMKIAELAQADLKPVERVIALLDWMIDDFILAGPAFTYAARYFATHNVRGKMIKSLLSPEREKAILGLKNAAWDITYLSEFVKVSQRGGEIGKRYILATCDKALGEVGSLLTLGREREDDNPSIEDGLRAYWSSRDARRITERFFECCDAVGPGRNVGAGLEGDPIGDMIADRELRILSTSPVR